MPDKKTIEEAEELKREGKSPSTQAGAFVHDEIEKIREGNHGARNTKQAIAIGLSEARRAGVDLKPQAEGKASSKTRKSEESAYEKGQAHEPVSKKRSAASEKALQKEPTNTVSRKALSEQTKGAAKRRSPAERAAAAKKASRTRKASKA